MTGAGTQPAIRDSLAELFTGASNFLERLPMLGVAFERTGVACAEELRGLSTSAPQLVLQGLEAGVAEDLLSAHDGAGVCAIVHAPKWGTRLVLTASRQAVVTFVELFLGGAGSGPGAAPRPMSKIEMGISRVLFERVASALATSFAPIVETPFNVEAVSQAIDYDVIGRRSNSIVVARFYVNGEVGSGEVLVAVPRSALNPMRQILSRPPAKEAAAPDPRWAQQMQGEVTRTHVALSAVLDERMGLLGEVVGFKPGQIIELNATASSRVRLECNGERLVWCHLGKSQGKYTLRVDEFVDREQEFMDELLSG
jgi:flagellar motor switch protein FliM